MSEEPIEVSAPEEPGGGLGARLRAVRQRSGLSLREVARQLGVSPSFVSQLENGKSQPSVATLYSLSQLLGVSIDELFKPDGQSSPTAGGKGKGGRSRARSAQPSVQDVLSRGDLGSPAEAWPADQGMAKLSRVTPEDRSRIVMDSGVIWEQLAKNTGDALDFIEIIYPVGSSSTTDQRMLRHTGYEYGFLLEGELEVTVGFDSFTLRPGESMGFDSSVPHLFRNTGSIPARGIWCVYHPQH
ncbi:MAG: helix-turn-helix domain-containing protein [Motilibacteraceae bacterium]